MREVRIAGVGLTPHGHFPHLSWLDLARAAAEEAVKDASIEPEIVPGLSLYVGTATIPRLTGEQFLAAKLAHALKLKEVSAVDVGGGEAAGVLALRSAWLEVASGICDQALVVGVESWSGAAVQAQAAALASLVAGREAGTNGVTRDIVAGLIADAYAREKDDVRQALDTVARKNRANAIHNPHAFHRRALNVSTLRDAPNVADPLTSAHVADLVDGAAAILLIADRPTLDRKKRPVRIAAIGSASIAAAIEQRKDILSDATQTAARLAYRQADCLPADIDVAEVYDAYAIHELTSLEGLGWVEPGEAVAATLRGETGFEGQRPVNPSGGLLGLGHALGAGGLAQVVAVARQVAGEAGVMQVANVRRGLAHCLGGAGAVAAVTILERIDG